MRIVGGSLKGRRLATPADDSIRPTSDRARQALFNLLAHGPYHGPEGEMPRGLDVLDVFAGTGAMAIEALSRGAASATFIDNDNAACALIRRNVEALGLRHKATVLRRDAGQPGTPTHPFSLCFLDPPYGKALAGPALEALSRQGWLAADAICVVETGKAEELAAPDGFELLDERRYGAARITILRHIGGAGD